MLRASKPEEPAMRPTLLAATLLPLSSGRAASPPPTTVTIALANYRYDPPTIRLRHGQPYVLHLVNRSGRKHNFVAPEFLVAAGAGRRAVEVSDGAVADIPIIAPAAGVYKVKCTHFTHALRGMKGNIIVE
jgi:plastocyanin